MTMPFAAVVGQAQARLALLLGAVDPGVGGVLLSGEKGTAKTTLVRGLAALLPGIAVVTGCRFSCDPASPDPCCPDGPHPVGPAAGYRPARLVELPLGATEDRVTGSLDVPRVLAGAPTAEAFVPGLLAQAHRGVLYVDEINLLPDHLVDVLLDAAATGVTTVEREGVSLRHASQFLLVGTMNPEEGELRPQLQDRFGLAVAVVASTDPRQRADAVRARLRHDLRGAAEAAAYDQVSQELTSGIAAGRSRLGDVRLPEAELIRITTACASLGVDGLRGDLVTARTAIAHAAWRGDNIVTEPDVREAARLALPHRLRRGPFDPPGLDTERLDEALAGEDDPEPPDDNAGGQPPSPEPPSPEPPNPEPDGPPTADPPAPTRRRSIRRPSTCRPLTRLPPTLGRATLGRASRCGRRYHGPPPRQAPASPSGISRRPDSAPGPAGTGPGHAARVVGPPSASPPPAVRTSSRRFAPLPWPGPASRSGSPALTCAAGCAVDARPIWSSCCSIRPARWPRSAAARPSPRWRSPCSPTPTGVGIASPS